MAFVEFDSFIYSYLLMETKEKLMVVGLLLAEKIKNEL